jgi:hypothetical protein
VRKILCLVLCVTAWLFPALATQPAAAADMTWTVRSDIDYEVGLAFYRSEGGYSWPGGGQMYPLRGSQSRTYTTSCHHGERICWGAWPVHERAEIHWGVGHENRYSCRGCCYICGESNPTIRLSD